jgi:hypothetical protein
VRWERNRAGRLLVDEVTAAINERVVLTVFRESIASVACALVVIAGEHARPGIEFSVLITMTIVGLLAAVRRVQLALWWTFGIMIGLALVRFS